MHLKINVFLEEFTPFSIHNAVVVSVVLAVVVVQEIYFVKGEAVLKCAHKLYYRTMSYVSANQEFLTQPESVVQAEGLDALFECRYPDPATYAWLVNESIVAFFEPPQNIKLGDGSTSVTILAIPSYNNTVIQCRVFDEDDGGAQVFSNEVSLFVFSEL